MVGKRRKICYNSRSKVVQSHNVSTLPSVVNDILSKDERFMYSMSEQQPETIEVRVGTAALQNQATSDRESIWVVRPQSTTSILRLNAPRNPIQSRANHPSYTYFRGQY